MEYVNKTSILALAKHHGHYYTFFKELARLAKPKVIVELGTWQGGSSAHFADGNPEARIITIDNHNCLEEYNRRPNIEYRHQDSLQEIFLPEERLDVDILFIDTLHDGVLCLEEFKTHEHLVSVGGVIFFDDVYLNPQMINFWKSLNPVGYDKFDLNLHYNAGFGCLVKQKEGLRASKENYEDCT